MNRNSLKTPTGRRQTSWLYTKRAGVEFGATEDKSIQWQGGGLEPGTSGLQVQRPNHWATLASTKVIGYTLGYTLIVTAFLVYCEQETVECTTVFFVFCPNLAGKSLDPLFDAAEFKSSYVQRAFQYLKLCDAGGQNLDTFCFVPGQVMGDHTECIEILTR